MRIASTNRTSEFKWEVITMDFIKALFKSLGTKSAPSSAYHPQTDDQSEIANRKVEEMIRAFASYKKDNCDDKLVDYELVYNFAFNCTTPCTPFYVNYGIHPRTIPLEGLTANNPSSKSFLESVHDTTTFVHESIVKQNIKMVECANKSRIPHYFNVDDYVWLSTRNLSLEDGSGIRKLNPKF